MYTSRLTSYIDNSNYFRLGLKGGLIDVSLFLSADMSQCVCFQGMPNDRYAWDENEEKQALRGHCVLLKYLN